MHEVLASKFFKYIDEKGNERVKSTKLNRWKTGEWEEKMSEIREWASIKLGVYIPEPNGVMYDY